MTQQQQQQQQTTMSDIESAFGFRRAEHASDNFLASQQLSTNYCSAPSTSSMTARCSATDRAADQVHACEQEDCTYLTTSLKSFIGHQNKHRAADQVHVCEKEHCTYQTTSYKSFIRHQRKHAFPKLKCPFCERDFKMQANLCKHLCKCAKAPK